jgi:hypothetical protein
MSNTSDSRNDDIDLSEAARALGRLGASKGGNARARSLSPEKRSEIARNAVKARWEKARDQKPPTPPVATHAGIVKIGGIELPCAVLEGGVRVFTQEGFLQAIGRAKKAPATRKPASGDEEPVEHLPAFLSAGNLKPFITEDLEGSSRPILFRPLMQGAGAANVDSGPGRFAKGYRVELLPLVCKVYLDARDAGVLTKSKRFGQTRIAAQCDILIRGLAMVGIIALVDEATGYQYDRARLALEEILEKYISKELARWTRTFENDFYENMFRLKGWRFTEGSSKRPVMAAQITLDVVYRRLAPGVLEELQRLSPKNNRGRRKNALFQNLSIEFGHPKLKEHLAAVVALMKSTDDKQYDDFERRLNRALPRYEYMPLFDKDPKSQIEEGDD